MIKNVMTRDGIYELATTSIDELVEYSKNVINGKEIACEKHIWACERFLSDLKRIGDKDFPYYFNTEKANKFLKWMTHFKHTKGPLQGKIKIPVIIEKFIFANIYGWAHIKTDYRRFRKAYWQVARKNAKSQDLAIVGLYELSGMGIKYSEVYIAATKKAQTRFVWGEASKIADNQPELKDKITTKFYDELGTKVIMHEKSGSFFARLSKDDKKSGDGGNPQCGLIDEYHQHPTSEHYDALDSGMKSREQPLLMTITTAGTDFNGPCYRVEYPYCSQILNPDSEINNDRYFVMINEMDTDEEGNLIDKINNEAAWIKANPIVATNEIGLDAIRSALKEAQDKPEKMADFMTKTLNVWMNLRASGYMNIKKWKQCGIKKMPKIKGKTAYFGFDLSAAIDLTSWTGEIDLEDGRILNVSHSFIPEATLFEKSKSDRVPYRQWVKEGYITVTPGAQVDYNFMIKHLEKFIEKYEPAVKELCFDRYFASKVMNDLDIMGYTVIEIPQGIPTLGEPTKDFRGQVYDKKIVHLNNPVYNWSMGNAVVRKDHNGNIMLDKSKSTERIDPVAAGINAHVRMWSPGEDETNVYEKRGMRSLE